MLLKIAIDDRCKEYKECKKDWTKCGTCPIAMEWVKKQKEINKRTKEEIKNFLTGSSLEIRPMSINIKAEKEEI